MSNVTSMADALGICNSDEYSLIAIDAGTGAVTGAVVGTFPLSAPALLGVGATAGAVNWGVKNTYHDEWESKS